MRDRRYGAAEAEPMPRRNIALGDRDEARQARFGGQKVVAVLVERALGNQISNREQLALVVEQEAKLHRQRHRPGGVFQDRQARLQVESRRPVTDPNRGDDSRSC